ncbi:NADP-dependent oxidoreductase [Mucilaginibacter sp. X5P1]|uniref:NADP-dependent oxidoreductase n=1 Tax=Mucilaginibacter sp. X5P1 TaxID=2723088 RepID=UPI00161818C0|nr:NADP-dependent oxidoreductase [Mucilaginibacter sp. X5P1]MBB6140143.1 NADPH:quinone reductase-like Zn-dependent oxidoreductase [Mucilaginibacter sp. X5P1]
MNAIEYTAYGNSDVIKPGQIDKPEPKDNEILIKVDATTVNPMDMKLRTGVLQQQIPLTFPYIPGLDVAGTIEAVGDKVSRLKVGDVVFATTFGGTYADYVVIKEEQAAKIPNNVSTEEAASLAVPLVTSYTFLVENGKVKAGEKVLIHGAAGGVGVVMVQMAKALGAYIIGTASGKGLELAKSYGADEVIDYKEQDFSTLVKDVALVIDLAGGETQLKSFGVIKSGGLLLSAVMPPSEDLAKQHNITAKFISSGPGYHKLEFGTKLVEEGKIKPQIAQTLNLKDAARAQDMVSVGGLNGKVVLKVGA